MIMPKNAAAVLVGVAAILAPGQAWAGYRGLPGDFVVTLFSALLVGMMALMPVLVLLFGGAIATFRNVAFTSAPIASFSALVAVLRWDWIAAAWIGFFAGLSVMWLAGQLRR
jgi:hypothetical protein